MHITTLAAFEGPVFRGNTPIPAGARLAATFDNATGERSVAHALAHESRGLRVADKGEGPRTLSREELYELVWSKPMLEAAQDFGISDVALAKRCRRLSIPVPGRGYWARVEAGQKPYRQKLPKREDQYGDYQALTMPERRKDAAESPPHDAIRHLESVSAFRVRAAALTIAPADSILNCIAAVKRTAHRLKHSRREELTFERGDKSGPMVSMTVSEAALDRACTLADRLLRAGEILGWTFHAVPKKEPEPQPQYGRYGRPEPAPSVSREPLLGELHVAGERVGVHIEERTRDEKREPTSAELAREKREYGYHAPRKTVVPTGNLRVVRLDTYWKYGAPNRVTWYDRGSARVEDQIADILTGFYELALSIKARRADDEREQRAREEAERRQKELEARQEANAQLVAQLETDAGAWHRARYLRRYVMAARKALGSASIGASFQKEQIDYLAWAERYVDQLDPLKPAQRLMEFEKRTTYYANDSDRMKEAFGRLLGGEWKRAWKLGANYSRNPQRGYYSERSVFEVDAIDTEDE